MSGKVSFKRGEAVMDIRTVIVPVTGTDSSLAVLDAAFSVAIHLGARVEGLHIRRAPPDERVGIGEGMVGTVIEEFLAAAEDDAKALAERARDDFATACEKAGFGEAAEKRAAHFHIESGSADEAFALHGCLADLIVVARSGKDDYAPMRATLEAALLESGRPIFVAPPAEAKAPLTTVAIGWNGSVETVRTVACALPILARAERVCVIPFESDVWPRPSAADLVAYLALHDVAATFETLEPNHRMIGEALLAEATAIGAGLLIMGAYTHSRLRRMIFGSVTEHMLSAAEIPVIMMH